MDKIYLVIEYDYENTDIIGVFDNKQKAEQLTEIKEDYHIEEYNVNELTEEGKRRILWYIKDLKNRFNVEE